ncbi:ATP-binding cassette domain-containing protein [Wenzhouxiangella sp. AB-CW3]|uniref:ATP-binding cassette domain-containing protein n=1 Tax=Wenzhouxiangella sp. AB-CW3 TaxID=2771012 RepID=UPI00168AEE23|nr:ATP-binding cassette domain-containing protein [Wenzhouxiangella sp. AB-CW3]QOC23232.1 ATP-binding cassette domain-containing protein [Wenzhouxiangella sp. AB-CW3]
MDYAIEASGLVKRFGETLAVDGVDLAVAPGQVLGLLGPNGAGKTTTVRMLATLTRPDAGQATVGGCDIFSQAHEVRGRIGLTGQFASVDHRLTGFENLFLIARLLGQTRADARQVSNKLLDQFELTEAAARPVGGYSGGMRRRLDLAASLVGNPRILFLDEPTTGLDPRARRQLWELIGQRVGDGTTVLLTTQYLEEADALADEILVIDHGRVIARGSPDELKQEIGARTLDIRPAQRADLDAVAGILTELTGVEPKRQGGRLSVPATDRSLLPELVRNLEARGIEPAELQLRSASLDEVFLALTGEQADSGDDQQQEKSP